MEARTPARAAKCTSDVHFVPQGSGDAFGVTNVAFDHSETVVINQGQDVVAFDVRIVKVIKIVETDDHVPAVHQ